MSDPRPIGVFDSGVGGLTVLQALQHSLPDESTIYLGDLARCPYGPRPQSEVRGFALQIADLLAEQDIKLLVIACNTATAAAFSWIAGRYPFPVVGVIDPGASAAAGVTGSGRIGVIATDGTVASGAYRDAVHRALDGAVVVQEAASWLVPVIEAGPITRSFVAEGLQSAMTRMHDAEIDTLILGCTHFPLVEDIFQSLAGPDVTVLDSAVTTATEVAEVLRARDLTSSAPAHHRLLVTGPAEAFESRAQAMFHACPAIETIDLATPGVR